MSLTDYGLNNSYAYDGLGRLTNLVVDTMSFVYSYPAGTASSLPLKVGMPGGLYVTNAYDGVGRLLETAFKSGTNTLNQHSYVYNAGSQRTKQTFKDGNYLYYTYDNIGQLKTAIGKESGGASRWQDQLGYAYDAGGNLSHRTNNLLVQTFKVDAFNELTNVTRSGTLTVVGATAGAATNVTVNGSAASRYTDWSFARTNYTLLDGNNSFTNVAWNSVGFKATNIFTAYLPASPVLSYDLNGNLTNDSLRVLEYDYENQLTNVYVASAWNERMTYDAFGRRRTLQQFGWSGGAWSLTNEVRYVYDGMLVVQERNGSGATVANYARGIDLSGTRQGAGGIGGLLGRADYSPYQLTLMHQDGNGNVTALVSASDGLVVGKYTYDSFGTLLAMTGPKAERNKYRFSSKEFSSLSGLYYYGFRYYDPQFQRWVNRDPIQEEGGINLYGFVHNAPVRSVDPFGLDDFYMIPPDWEPNLEDWVKAGEWGLEKVDLVLSPINDGIDKMLKSKNPIFQKAGLLLWAGTWLYGGGELKFIKGLREAKAMEKAAVICEKVTIETAEVGKALEVFQRAKASKGLLIGPQDVVAKSVADGYDKLLTSNWSWDIINKAWLDGAVAGNLPVRIVGDLGRIGESLATGASNTLLDEIRYLMGKGYKLQGDLLVPPGVP